MNETNRVELEGTVHGDTWTSAGGSDQRGRVNFWLAVSRQLAGDGFELLQCGIEPRSGDELLRLDRELREGRTVHLVAVARSLVDVDLPLRGQEPRVVFIAQECGLDGEEARSAHRVGLPRRHHAHGKAAAAGDLDLAEREELLPLESEGQR